MLIEYTSEKIPIKAWLDDLDNGALTQATHLANLPFAFSHVAIMPDSHLGIGMPIGGVVALQDTIIPNAVGVDISCFTADTKVRLADSRNISMLELIQEFNAGKENFIFSKDENNNIVIDKIVDAKQTNAVNELIEITLDNHKKYKCTTDHIHYRLDGTEVNASNLRVGDSLFPLYIKKSEDVNIKKLSFKDKRNKLAGYDVIYNPNIKKYDYVHHLADNYNRRNNIYHKKGIRHHADFNKLNNNPTNIKIVSWKKHWKIHSDCASYTASIGVSGWKAGWRKNKKKWSKLSSIKMRKLQKNPEFVKIRNAAFKKTVVKYLKSKEFYDMTRNAGVRGRKYLIKRNKSLKGREKSREIAHRKFKCLTCNQIVISGFGVRNHRAKHKDKTIKFERLINHRIISIRKIKSKEKIPVYCLTTQTYHNFALDAGVFVHNCGMHSIKTDITDIDKTNLVKILTDIRNEIPVGFAHRQKANEDKMPKLNILPGGIVEREYQSATKQVGTLGGGNHFLEIQKGDDGFIYAMIHSGSRNIGKQVCDYYNKIAKERNSMWHTAVPKEWELASLPVDSQEGTNYIEEMKYCMEFANNNRAFMMDTIKDSFKRHLGAKITWEYDINHNYAAKERHFGRNVWVHRKGATNAEKDQTGLIPGSQGTSSYIVKGKGNMWSFNSCSHGAGRKLARNVAKRTLNFNEEKKKLDDQGILHSVRNINDLDEAAGAYKDIDVVMGNQKDLVDIVVKLKPLAVVKG